MKRAFIARIFVLLFALVTHAATTMMYLRAKTWVDLTCGGLIIALGIRRAFC